MIFSTDNLPKNIEFSLKSDLPNSQFRKLVPSSESFEFPQVPTPNFSKLDYSRVQGSEETYLRDILDWIGALNLRLDGFLNFSGDVKEGDTFVSSFTPDLGLFDKTLPMQSISYSGLVSPNYIEVPF